MCTSASKYMFDMLEEIRRNTLEEATHIFRFRRTCQETESNVKKAIEVL